MTEPSIPVFRCPECGRDCRSRAALDACCMDDDDDEIGFVHFWRNRD